MSGGRARFGAMDGAALVVSTIVGAGIFTVPAYVARLAVNPSLTLALWVLGGLMALAGALSFAEMAARMPRGGAEYVYLREAFGPTMGFLSGWMSFIAGFSGAIAAAAVGFAAYASGIWPTAGSSAGWVAHVGPLTFTLSGANLVAVTLIAVFTVVSIVGVRASRVATNALALLIVAGISVLAVAGFAGDGVAAPLSVGTAPGMGAFAALVPIFFTYSGWNAAAYVAGEFRDPQRTIPRALIGGTLIVTVLYVALNGSLLRALHPAGLAASPAPVAGAAGLVLGPLGSTWVTMLVLAALASSVCAMVITGSRIYMEMARDGMLPALFARASRRDGVPVTAAIAQSAWSALLVVTGTFEQIVTFTGFAIVVMSGITVCALFVLRRRLGPPSTYRVPFYPFVPVAFIVCAIAIAVASFRYAPGPSLAGVAMIAAGVPVRWLGRARGGGAPVRVVPL